MTGHRAVLVTAAVAALVLGGATAADADPKRGEVITLDCDALGTLDVAVNGNGQYTPGLVAGSTRVLVPYAFDITGTFTPTEGEPETFHEVTSKPGPRHGWRDVCTFSESGSDEFGTFEVAGTVWVSYTGR